MKQPATLLLLITTCLLGGYLLSSLSVASASTLPPPPAAKRSYICVEGASSGDVMKKANALGERGWRMVAANQGARGGIWCFEQYGAHPQPETP